MRQSAIEAQEYIRHKVREQEDTQSKVEDIRSRKERNT